jgi:molecular chaperone IbpA
MTQLVRIDTTALNQLNRALIGFDRIFHDYENRFQSSATNYPPHNVIKVDDDNYEIQLAVAGFSDEEISVEVVQDHLVVKGETLGEDIDDTRQYLHRGLAARDFQRVFPLAEYIEVIGAETAKGILTIKLQRIIPESAKPKKIEIKKK